MKSKCCNAEVNYSGGGYNGEELCPVEINCLECGEKLSTDEIIYEDKDGVIEKKDLTF